MERNITGMIFIVSGNEAYLKMYSSSSSISLEIKARKR